MDSITDRIRRSIAQRGLWGTVRLCAVELGWRIVPTLRRAEAMRKAADSAFDAHYGVDTGGVFRPKPEEVVGANWALGGNYQAVDPVAFDEALNLVSLPHETFTFIDLGSGKGRTLLLAARFPFRKVIGVEYCTHLNHLARQNVQRFSAPARRCGQIQVVEADAAEYEFPSGPLVLFLNNPFSEPVMAKVVNHVAGSFRHAPRRMVVIYFWPRLAHLWEQSGFLRRLQRHPAIFDTAEEFPAPAPCASGPGLQPG